MVDRAEAGRGARRVVGRAGRLLLDAFLPPLCLACAGPVQQSGQLCAGCWKDVRFIAAPLCACCGAPFELAMPEGTLCGACLAEPPPFGRARAALSYEGVGRDLVLGFKMADRTFYAPAFADWLARAGATLLAEADVLVPVPLHRWRLLSRRFNQAALMAHALSRRSGLPVLPDALVRVRATPSQASLRAADRVANVRGAFAARGRARSKLEGRRVVLIDDVLTTGATASACARALLKAGAKSVDVLTLARRDRKSDGVG